MKAKALHILQDADGALNPNVRIKGRRGRKFMTKPTGNINDRHGHDFASAMASACGPRTRSFSNKIGRLYRDRNFSA